MLIITDAIRRRIIFDDLADRKPIITRKILLALVILILRLYKSP
jgi:hypothetical protein